MSNSNEMSIDDLNLRLNNREQLIENLQRVIQEKNASITKLEEREQILQETLTKRNAEFHQLEDKLKQFEEKTLTFEQLHRLQVQTFEKTIRDNQIENERLCEQINDLTNELREKSSYEAIHQEKLLTFDRIVADIRLWREKLDDYKSIIEQREETIENLKKEINDLQKKKQTNVEIEDESTRFQLNSMQKLLQDREKEIENLKLTLRRVRDTLQPARHSRWQSYEENLHRTPSPRKRSLSPSIDVEGMKKKIRTLTDHIVHLEELLVQRDDQLTTLRKVHDKRWLRLKHLQKQHRSLKDELQLYTDDETLQRNNQVDYSYRKAVRKPKSGCSICNDHRWKKSSAINTKVFKQEDDDQVWNEVTKLRKENARLHDENLTFQEKLDLQQVEINEQIIIIGELRNEIRALSEKNKTVPPTKISTPTILPKLTDEQTRLIEQLDKKLFELENERTDLIVEQERLKTNFDLCRDEKQNLLQQRNQMRNDLKKSKLRILALQDQIEKFKRNQKKNVKKETNNTPIIVIKRRIPKKKAKKASVTKSCLELLLDQNSTIIDDLQNSTIVSVPRRTSSCSSTISRKRLLGGTTRPTSSSTPKIPSVRISTLRDRIEQLEIELAEAQTENEHLQQRLSSTLTRISILKTTNDKLTNECDQLKTTQPNSTTIDHNAQQIDHLYERLKNTSLDAAQQRKINKNLQIEIENLNKQIQTLNDKLIHAERDISSKRLLIENYKSQLEIQNQRNTEKTSNEQNDERMKSLMENNEKLRTSIESYKNRLQAMTRDKHEVDQRYNQTAEENSKLKIRSDEIQLKFKTTEQQIRQLRHENEQLNKELISMRRSFDDQLANVNTKHQETLNRMRIDFDRSENRTKECEKFVKEFLYEMIRRNGETRETMRRAYEHQKQRDSLSMSLPGYDAAMNTASKILNLTQDDLDEIMSMTDESFHVKPKNETETKDEKIKEKVSKLFASNEQFAGKLLKIFQKKLDDIQTADRELASMRN